MNAGRLDAPYDKSYNLNDYDAILASAKPAGNVSVNGEVVGSAFTYQIEAAPPTTVCGMWPAP